MDKRTELLALLDVYGALLTENQRDLFAQYYEDDLSLGEIAQNQGVTRQGIWLVLQRAEEKLQGWEAALGFAARERLLGARLARIEQLATRVADATAGHGSLRELHVAAAEISALCADGGGLTTADE